MLPVDYLDNGEIDFSKCIGLFSYYNQNNPNGNPAVNATLTSLGYNVSGVGCSWVARNLSGGGVERLGDGREG
jgi:hypothetical protein